MSLDGFHKRRLYPSEPISVYVHEMKKLLRQAMPELVGGPRNQLLLHQFLSGIPEDINKPIRTASEVKSLEQAVEKARLLIVVDSNNPSAVAAVSDSQESQVQEFQGQISALTEQVAALSTRRQTLFRQTMRCYSLACQTVYRLVPARSEGSGHPCTHF